MSHHEVIPATASTRRLTRVKQSMDQLHNLIEETRSKINHTYRRKTEIDAHPKAYNSQFSTNYKNYETTASHLDDPHVSIQISPKNLKDSKASSYHISIDDKKLKSKIDMNLQIKSKNDGSLYIDRQEMNSSYRSRPQNQDLYSFNSKTHYGDEARQHQHSCENFVNQGEQIKFSDIIRNQSVPLYSRKSSQIRNQSGILTDRDKSFKSKSPEVYDYSNEAHHISYTKTPTRFYQTVPLKSSPYIDIKQKSIQKKLYDSLISQENEHKLLTITPPQKQKYRIARNLESNLITPRNYLKRRQNLKSITEIQQPKTMKINLNQLSKRNNTQRSVSKQTDRFGSSKEKYLNHLRRQQKQRSKVNKNNRSYSGKKRHSLSPKCEAVTNRLYEYRNKLPCTRCEKHHGTDNSLEIKKILKEYGFIRRYLSDNQINDIFTNLEHEGVPKEKWSVEIVNFVYKKLKFLYISS